MIAYKRACEGDTSREFITVDNEKWVEVFRTADAALPDFLLRDNPDLVIEAGDGRRYRVRRM